MNQTQIILAIRKMCCDAHAQAYGNEGAEAKQLAEDILAILGPPIPSADERIAALRAIMRPGRPLIIFDLETNGTDTATARIIEIGMIKLLPDGTDERIEKLINPEAPLDPVIVELTGITDEQLAAQPKFRQIAKSLFSFVQGCDFAGFKIRDFDLPILWEELFRAGLSLDLRDTAVVDGCKIFNKYEQRTLGAGSLFYLGEEQEKAHRALADCDTTLNIIGAQLIQYPDLPRDAQEITAMLATDRRVDLAGKIVLNEKGIPVWTFGSGTIGQPVASNPKFAYWVLEKNFPENTKHAIRMILAEKSGA